jgi:hypothetical protein
MDDGITIVNEYKSGSFQADYQNHFSKLVFDTGDMNKKQILSLSFQVYSNLNLTEIEVNISSDSVQRHILNFKADESRYNQQVVEKITNYINSKLVNAKGIDIHSIISSFKINKEKETTILMDFKVIEYDFEGEDSEDVQIQMVKDYIKIKEYYKLTSLEMDKLSKKQKRYLLYLTEKNK